MTMTRSFEALKKTRPLLNPIKKYEIRQVKTTAGNGVKQGCTNHIFKILAIQLHTLYPQQRPSIPKPNNLPMFPALLHFD
jgi:hypothetical protein